MLGWRDDKEKRAEEDDQKLYLSLWSCYNCSTWPKYRFVWTALGALDLIKLPWHFHWLFNINLVVLVCWLSGFCCYYLQYIKPDLNILQHIYLLTYLLTPVLVNITSHHVMHWSHSVKGWIFWQYSCAYWPWSKYNSIVKQRGQNLLICQFIYCSSI